MSVYKLAATGAGGTENGIAQLDVQFDGMITAIAGSVDIDASANGDNAVYECSFISVNTVGTNDTRGTLFSLRQKVIIGAAGETVSAANSAVGGLAIVVNAGERLWLHAVVTAAKVSKAEFYIYVEDGQGAPVPQRRR